MTFLTGNTETKDKTRSYIQNRNSSKRFGLRCTTCALLLISAFFASSVRSDSSLLHSGMSDCVLARERLEIGDVARAQFFSEFQTGRSMNTTHVTLMMRRNAHGSPLERIPVLWNCPVCVKRGQHFCHGVYVAHLCPIKLPVFIIEEWVHGYNHSLVTFGRLDPVPVPASVSQSIAASHLCFDLFFCCLRFWVSFVSCSFWVRSVTSCWRSLLTRKRT